MNESRRSILRKASALSALAVGASGMASAADCSGAPDWDATTLYEQGDQVSHPDGEGVDALWEAALESRNAEPSRDSAYWDHVGDCGSSGNQSPTASFTTDVSTPEPGEDVTFDASGSSDPDGSISSYDWDFDDGSSATGETATHSYESSGDYTVTLTVTDDAGATGTATTTVSVSDGGSGNEAPNASFTVSPSAPTPDQSVTVDAADSSDPDGSISSYEWEFGDGATANGQTASHSYAETGDYTVTLTVTDDDGASDSNSTTVSVQSSNDGVDCSGVSAWDSSTAYSGGDQVTHDGTLWTAEWWTQGTEPAASADVWTAEGTCTTNEVPSASFTVSPSNPDPGESAEFDASGSTDPDGTIESYEWEFGDGSTDSGETTSHSYDAAQVVTVVLTVTDDGGETASATQEVTVGDPNLAPDASFTNDPASPDPGEEVTFDASDSGDEDGEIASYEWEFGDGSSATGETVTHTFDSEDTYEVTLTVTDDEGATGTTTTELGVGTGPGDEFKVIGYYPGWKAEAPYDYYPEDIPWGKVTDVQYAFLGVDASAAEPTIMSDQDEQNLQAFSELKDGPASDTRIILSVGGWADSEGFSEIAATQSNRESFADRCVEILREYNLDGIDIDWEHPGSQQGTCGCGSNEDYETHVDLLQAIRDAFDDAGAEDGKHYHLSVANGGSDWNAGGIRHGKVGDVCDYASIMAYDFTGSWMDVAGQNAPLYGDGHPTENTQYGETYHAQYYVEWAVDELWAGDHGETGYWPGQWEYPPAEPAEYDELVLGLPFYGRGFNGTELYSGYQGLPEGTWHDAQDDGADATGAFDYGDIEENMEGADGWTKGRHDPGAVPYIVNEEEETIISYDDAQSIAEKVRFAKERGMQGVMFWELSQDWNETLLDTILEEI